MFVSDEVRRLENRWRYVATVTFLTLFVSILGAIFPTSAFATNLGTPPYSGYYAICNTWQTVANVGGGGFGNWNLQVGGLCNVGTSAFAAGGIAVGINDVDFGGNDSLMNGSNTISTTSLTACSGNGQHFYWNTSTQKLQFNFCANVADGSGNNHVTAVTGMKVCLAGGTSQANFTDAGFHYSSSSSSGCGSGGNARIDSFTSNSAPYTQVSNNVLYPQDYFNGGTPGPTADADKGTSTCSRTLSDTQAMTGQFFAGRTSMVHASVTAWDWNWGDSTTHGTLQNQNHSYGAISTQPTNGWTAVITMTVTADSGHVFSDNTTSQTGTCSLRVDFLNPSQSTAGTTGQGGSTGDTGLDACLPSGWNVLNPLALIGGVGCVLKYLFIPSSTTVSSLGHLWDTVTTHLPFSIVTGFVDYIPNMWSDFQSAVNGVSPLTGGSETSPLCSTTRGGSMPDGSPFQFCVGGEHYPFTNLSSQAMVGILRAVFLFIIVALFVYAMWRGANEILQ